MAEAARKTITAKANRPVNIDPAITALDRHKKANRVFFDRARVADEQPESSAAEINLQRASATADHFAWELATTEPVTLVGLSEMLNYIVDAPAVGLFDLGECSWHETAFKTVARALANIARARSARRETAGNAGS